MISKKTGFILSAASIILPCLSAVAQDVSTPPLPVAATPTVAPTPPFKASGKVWGYVFGDYYYKFHADEHDRGTGEYSKMKEGTNAFELRRVYLGYDYTISEKFSAELLLSNEKNYDASANRTVFVKAANVKWKNFLPNNDLLIGQSSTPTWSFIAEKAWGYRSVERTITDIHKAGSSNDLGLALQGRLDSLGNAGYNVMIGNGTGSKVESDEFKKVYWEFYLKMMDQRLVLDIYGDYETTFNKQYRKSKLTTKFFFGWQTPKFTMGLEAFMQSQENYTTYTDSVLGQSSHADVSPFGAALFVRGSLIKDKLAFFARTDVYDPDSKYHVDFVYASGYSGYNTELFSVFGVDITPHKNVHLIPNLWFRSYQSRLTGATGTLLADYDLVPRLTFHYIFK